MLIGRAAAQRRIDELLESARTGSSETLVLVGDPGIGKTALLAYAAAQAPAFAVVRAQGVESEAEIPFASLYELCRPFLDRLDLLAPPQATALGAAFGISDGETSRFAVGAGTLSLLAAAAEERPLLLRSSAWARPTWRRNCWRRSRMRPIASASRSHALRPCAAARCWRTKRPMNSSSSRRSRSTRSIRTSSRPPGHGSSTASACGSRRRIDAREQLHAALTVFERLEARPWAERARAELRASGERLRRYDPTTDDELTPQELQIALLVAAGEDEQGSWRTPLSQSEDDRVASRSRVRQARHPLAHGAWTRSRCP